MLEKFNKIWDKVCEFVKKGLDSKHAYNDKYVKTKVKSYE